MVRLIDILASGVTDESGEPLADGQVYFYEAGTTTPQTAFENFECEDPHSNPATLDDAGRLIAYADGRVKLVIVDSDGATIRTIDDVGTEDSDVAAAASSVSAGSGLSAGVDNSLAVNVDDATIEISEDTLRVKDEGIIAAKLGATSVTAAKLGSDVAGDGLTGGNGAAIAVNPHASLEIISDALRVKNPGVLGIVNARISCAVATNALTITLLGIDGNAVSATNPVHVLFRNTTATSGAALLASVVAVADGVTSLIISSGSTLGHKDATDHYIYVYALYQSASSFELVASSSLLDEGSVQSTTAEGASGGADSIRVAYSRTARTNAPIRLIARLKSNQTTAGTWAAAPTEVSMVPFSKRKAYFSATGSAATNLLTGVANTILFPDIEVDTHNSYDVTTGIYTMPMAGIAKVSAAIKLNVTGGTEWTALQIFQARLVRSGGVLRYGEWVCETGSTGASPMVHLSAIIAVAAGDQIKIDGYQDSGATYALVTAGSQGFNCFQVELDPYAA